MRGIVHLSSANTEQVVLRANYPRAVNGIKVAQRAHQIHFLHGTGWARFDPAGTPAGKYIVHLANGEQRDVPVCLATDICDWHLSRAARNQPTGGQSKLAWRGKSGIGEDQELGLCMKTWENPLPDVEITRIDFVSAMNEAAPFLLAITVE